MLGERGVDASALGDLGIGILAGAVHQQHELALALVGIGAHAFGQLRERAVVVLHELEGYTHKELASLFGQSESYSKSVLARALKRLGVQDGGANEWRGDA